MGTNRRAPPSGGHLQPRPVLACGSLSDLSVEAVLFRASGADGYAFQIRRGARLLGCVALGEDRERHRVRDCQLLPAKLSIHQIKSRPSARRTGATFNLVNGQFGGKQLEVEKIECGGMGACNNMQIVLSGQVTVMEMICNPGECEKCVIRTDDPRDPTLSCIVMALQMLKYPA